MTDLMSGHGVYEGWDENKRLILVDKLLNVLLMFRGDKRIQSFTCTVDLEAYERRKKQLGRMPTPSRICARIAFPMTTEWYRGLKNVSLGKIEAFFDRNEEFMRHIYADWTSKVIRRRDPFWELVGSIGASDMEDTTALQIADVIAWGRNRLESGSSALVDEYYPYAFRAAGGLYWNHLQFNEQRLMSSSFREEGAAAVHPQRLRWEQKIRQEFGLTTTSDEFKRFDEMMHTLMRVPHAEIKAALDAEKQAKQGKKKRKAKKPSAADRVDDKTD
jgi:hypothetical protein